MSLCLFRLMEAKSGYITIDGYPLHRIPLHLLRSKLNIIPQDPVLFAHSVSPRQRSSHQPHRAPVTTPLTAALPVSVRVAASSVTTSTPSDSTVTASCGTCWTPSD